MMAYTIRYQNELRNAADYFRDIKETAINEDALEMAEALIAKKTAKFDLSKFEDGYETAVRELVEAKVKNQPIPQEEVPAPRPSNVVNLMDALRKSIGAEGTGATKPAKKPPVSEKEPAAKSIGLVKPTAKSAPKRKTA
jgi:DNA end-binding protein Ku